MIPEKITAGDTLKFTESPTDYSPDDGWSFKYVLVKSDAQIVIDATDNGDGSFLINEPAADTASWVAGDYDWESYATKGVDRYRVNRGFITITPDIAAGANSSGIDVRTEAKKIVDAIEAYWVDRASKNQLDLISYSIRDRSSSNDPQAIRDLYDDMKRVLKSEQDEARISQGRGSKRNKIRVRFTG
jgi:hypothetical protein